MIEKTNLKTFSDNNNNNIISEKDILQNFKRIDEIVNIVDVIINKKQNNIYLKYKNEKKKYKEKLLNIEKLKKEENIIKQKINIEIKKKELFKLIYNLLNNIRFVSSERKKLLEKIINNSNNIKEIENNINTLKKII